MRDIVVFTLHKSGSMFLHGQSQLLSRLGELPYHSPNVPESGLDARRLLTDRQIWTTRHGCFAPVRFYVPLPDVDRYDILLHLRDPRDVLVSMFYSYCFIHAGEIPPNTGYRKAVADEGIDAFVLSKARSDGRHYRGDYGTGGHVEEFIGGIGRRYRNYLEHLLGRPNVTLLRYEQMVTDYRGWLDRFIQPFPLPDKARVVDELVAQSATFFPKRDADAMTHVRHVTPGDHRAKLLPSTIEAVEREFADILDALGYPRSPA